MNEFIRDEPAGQEQLASETVEKWRLKCKCVKLAHTLTNVHIHTQMAEEFSPGFDMQIGCWLVISGGCNTVLSFLQHNIRADNIHLKGGS